MLRRVAAAVGAMSLAPALLAAGPPGPCAVVDGAGRCLVGAADPARPGGPAARTVPRPSRPPATRPRPGSGADAVEPAPPKLAGLPRAGGWVVGPVPTLPGLDAPPAPAAAAPPAPTAAVLAQRAIKLLTLRPPVLRTSARDTAYVGVPLWLWIERGQATVGPVSATATAGAAQVTATARLVATRWRMGPPGATVTCAGTGTPWTGQAGPSPDCGYTYATRSLPERTGGRGAWTVAVTGMWQVNWSGVTDGAPVAGEQELDLTTPQPLQVGELQVLITGSGG